MAHRTSTDRRPDAAPLVMGVDIGGVITMSTGCVTGEDTFFGRQPMNAPVVDGAVEALRQLAERFEYRVWLVSKAGTRVSAVSRAWLHHVGFWRLTGIPDSNLEFVTKRADKAPVCARLGVTHFVDDHLDVLEHLRSCVPNLYWFRKPDGQTPSWVAAQSDVWTELQPLIERDLA